MSQPLRTRLRTTRTRTGALVAALALAVSLTPAAAADRVGQDDIDQAKANEASTSSSIAGLEAQIAQLSVDSQAAQVAAQVANEDYLSALDELDTATTDAKTAQDNADKAATATADARSNLGAVVVQTYQEGDGALDALAPYLSTDSWADVADADAALARAGENTDAKVQDVEALQAVADTMQSIADGKVTEKKTAADTATTAKADADAAAVTAASAVTNAQTQRTDLINQLAVQRNTTVALETEYQNQLEADRKAREEAEAKAAAEAAAKEAAAQAEVAAAQAAAKTAADAEAQRQADAAAAAQAAAPVEAAPVEEAAPAPVEETAPVQEPDPAPVVEEPVYSGDRASIAIASAQSYIGVPYVWAGESYSGVDCSGLTMLAYQDAGVYLTHSSRAQYGEGTAVSLGNMQAGDLIFWSYDGTQSGIYHVAMYLGGGQMIEAPYFGMTVHITSVSYSGGIMPFAVRP